MKIHHCKNKKNWIEPKTGSFLQSWDWGSFQINAGRSVERIQIKEGNTVVGQIQAIAHQLPFGQSYLFVPGLSSVKKGVLPIFANWAKDGGYAFVHVDPVQQIDLLGLSNQKAKSKQPQHTLMLDLSKNEEALLSGMHHKTRYNIRLAERKGVHIKEEKDIDVFWSLLEETTSRDGFRSHKETYYKKMLKLDMVRQFTATVEGEPAASILCISHGDTFIYLHGASSQTHKSFMAPQLLQWHALKEAQKEGRHHYDFWGIAPLSENGDKCYNKKCWDSSHAWSGVTRFKVGFGGRLISHPDSFDLILNSFVYYLYRSAKVARKFV